LTIATHFDKEAPGYIAVAENKLFAPLRSGANAELIDSHDLPRRRRREQVIRADNPAGCPPCRR